LIESIPANKIVAAKIQSITMRLSTGWSAHFSAFSGSNTVNVKMAMFSDAMDDNKSKMEKINNVIKEEDTVALVKGKNGQINELHGFKKFG
jgi:hypothetical protein